MGAKQRERLHGNLTGIDPAFIEQVRQAAHTLAGECELPNYYGVAIKLGATNANAVAIDAHLLGLSDSEAR